MESCKMKRNYVKYGLIEFVSHHDFYVNYKPSFFHENACRKYHPKSGIK